MHQQSERAVVPRVHVLVKITYVAAQAVVGKLERQRSVNAERVEIHTCARIRSVRRRRWCDPLRIHGPRKEGHACRWPECVAQTCVGV